MTVHQGYAREQNLGRNDGTLSRHIGTWGENAREYGEEGWSHLSYDSSEMEKVASPFDDIGFLAGGPTAADPLPPPKTQAKKEHAIPKQRHTVVSNTNDSTTAKNPAIGRFLEKERCESPGSTNDNMTSHSRTSGGRLDKTLSTRDMFNDGEASLALLLALGDEKRDNVKSTRVHCDVSVASLGLSVLGSSKAKISEDSRGTSGGSKSSFFTAMTSQNASRNRSFDTSKSSISGLFGSSKSSTSAAPLSKQTKSSKFLIMKRKETPEKKLEKSEEKVVRLETENVELSKENCLLRAKLEELDGLSQHQKTMMEWISIEQLASVTTEMWQHQSKALQAHVHIDKLEAKLEAFQRLVDAKERSINNLEKIRNKQEQRIGYLEVQCLQNGLDVSEIKRRSVSPATMRPVLLNIPVDSDVQTNDYLVDDDLCPAINHSNRTQSTGVSDISDESDMEEIPTQPNSWATLNMELVGAGALPRHKPLETFLVANEVHTEPCLETSTWDPTKNLGFADRHSTSRQCVGVDTLPPTAPEQRTHTPPAPMGRKHLIQSHSTKSKSPRLRRRLKGTTKSEFLELSGPVDNGSTSTASRRKVKKETPTTNPDPTLKRSSSSNSITMRRAAKAASRNNDKWGDPLGSSSTHSIGSRRRLRGKKDADFDRLTVSSALEKALGSSTTELDEIPKNDHEDYAVPTTMIRRAVSEGGSRLWGVPSKAQQEAEDEEDDGLDLLDAVFQD